MDVMEKMLKGLEPSILDRLKDKLSFYKERIESIIKWGWRGRSLQVWDFTSLLSVMQDQMKDMESAMRENDRHKSSIKSANQMLWAIGLIERYFKNEYCQKEWNRLEEYRKKNDPNPDSCMPFCVESKTKYGLTSKRLDTKESHKYNRTSNSLYEKARSQKAADLTQMLAILDKRIQGWWY